MAKQLVTIWVIGVSLSDDGQYGCIGAALEMMVMEQDSGHVRIYSWDGAVRGIKLRARH